MESQLQFCRDLLSALLNCQEGRRVPVNFDAVLVHACQRLMLEAVQLQQEEQLRSVRHCLEDALQLMSRVGCLGPIEAFFTADDLLSHYQRRLTATQALGQQLQQARQQTTGASTTHLSAAWSSCSADSSHDSGNGASGSVNTSDQLVVPEQQLRVVQTFRSYAAQLCPRLTGSCSAEVLQQLCDVVRQGLVLVQGHSFLLGQEWQLEAAAMLGRAEQLKVLLAHRQAHHISLLAALLQLMHRQEVQEYDSPRQPRSLSTAASGEQPYCALLLNGDSSMCGTQETNPAPAGKHKQHGPGQVVMALYLGQPARSSAYAVVAGGLVPIEEAGDQDDDEFYMPVAPLARASSTAASTHASATAGSPIMPFDVSHDSGSTIDASEDSLVRMPSSGCSSLLEYVHSMPSTTGSNAAFLEAAEGSNHYGHYSSSTSYQQQLRRITEEQLQSIAGREAAAVLAAALGVVLESRETSRRGSQADSSRDGGADGSSGRGNGTVAGCRRGTAAVRRRCGSAGASCDGSRAERQQACWDADVVQRQMSEVLLLSSCAGSRPASPGPLSRSSSGSQLCMDSSRAAGASPVGPRNRVRSHKQQQQQQQQWLLQSNRTSSCTHVDAAGSGIASEGSSPHSGNAPCPKRSSAPCSSSSTRHAQHTLRLQHTQLPAGCCRSIGAVLYISPHLTRLELVAVGLDDQAIVDLVDALKVNSSIVLLDLSQNAVEDVGARALAGLLRERSCGSSRLRVLCLQHNQIGDDGVIALASGLTSNTQLHRLWLQHNAIGPPGAMALATAMQHNTSCTSLKLLQGNAAVPEDVGQTVQKLARHNRGVRQRIKGLVQHVLLRRGE